MSFCFTETSRQPNLVKTSHGGKVMSEIKKYRLGNQPEEYELVDKYVGLIPKGFHDWDQFCDSYYETKLDHAPRTLVNAYNQEIVTLILRTFLSKDAFPLSFYGEDRADNWWHFCLASTIDERDKIFIIPLH